MKAFAIAGLAALVIAPAATPNGNSGPPTGYVARIDRVSPAVQGVQASIVRGDVLVVQNATRRTIEILDPSGQTFLRFRPFLAPDRGVYRLDRGRWRRVAMYASYAWHDPRVVGRGDPPAALPGVSRRAPRFVRRWTVPGRTADRRFVIAGTLNWIPPKEDPAEGVPTIAFVGGAAMLVALSALAAYFLGRKRA